MNDNGARGSDDPILKITLLEHELDEAQRENLRLRQTLLEPPYSQLRSVIRQYPHVSKTAIKALNVVTGRRWSATSDVTWSKARCRNVE